MPRIRAESIEQHKVVTRSLIVDAALESFAGAGYDRTTLGSIADAAGIPRSSIYEYFANKEAILGAVIEDRVPPLFNEWFAGIPEGNAIERLEGLFETTFRMMLEHPQVASLVVGPGRQAAGPETHMGEMVTLVKLAFAEMCAEGIEEGLFPPGDPQHLGAAVGDLLIGGVNEMLESPDPAEARGPVLETRLRMLRAGILGPD
jgi:AcrR family transcriptional regulator